MEHNPDIYENAASQSNSDAIRKLEARVKKLEIFHKYNTTIESEKLRYKYEALRRDTATLDDDLINLREENKKLKKDLILREEIIENLISENQKLTQGEKE
jgi:hypothetical protein